MTMVASYRQLAGYNRWANAQLYAAALALPQEIYARPIGVFFGSLPATLNHLLATDRIWLKRLNGAGEAPDRLDAILFDDRVALARARIAEDQRIIALIDGYDDAALTGPIAYSNMSGQPQRQPLADILAHLFNHQTHHRGQAHACLSLLTGTAPPSFDLVLYQRGFPAADLKAALASVGP